MREFFSVYKRNYDKFLMFSPLHIAILLALCLIISSMIIFRKNLKQKSGLYRYLIVVISLVLECSYLTWIISAGKWDIRKTLPLELCEVTFILCIVMLIVRRYKLFEVAYFWGFTGSTLALIFPGLNVSYHHFPFWAFMLTHSLNLISLVFIMITEKYQAHMRATTRKSIRLSFMVTNIYMLLIAAVNRFLGSKYFYYYIFKKPAPNIPNPLMYTNSWFLKILILEGAILIGLLICYLPFTVAYVFKRKQALSMSGLIGHGESSV